MKVSKLLKTAAVCTGAVVEKSVSVISSALSKEKPHELYDIVGTPDMENIKDHIMLDFEKDKEDVVILVKETEEGESDNDDKIVIL